MAVQEINNLFSIELYDTYVPEPLLSEVNSLITNSGLNEPFDYMNSKYFVVAHNNDELIGIVTYGDMDVDGVILPRFLHIIIAPKYKRSKLAYKMLVESEQELKKLGFNMIVCFVRFDLGDRDMKIGLAKHNKYLKYKQNEVGEFFYKLIK